MKGSTVLTECACGRSPIGICIGWHELDEKQYTVRLAAWKKNQAEKDNKEKERNYGKMDKDIYTAYNCISCYAVSVRSVKSRTVCRILPQCPPGYTA